MLLLPMFCDRRDGRRVACELEADDQTWTAERLIDAFSLGVRQLLGIAYGGRLPPATADILDDGRVVFSFAVPAGRVTSGPLVVTAKVMMDLGFVWPGTAES